MKNKNLFKVVLYLLLTVVSFAMVFPLVPLIFASLKGATEFNDTGPLTPPKNWLNFHNFAIAWTQGDLAHAFFNTGILLSVSLVGTILIGTMTAYALDRFDFRGKKVVVWSFLVATLVPGVTTQVATFQIINKLNLYNTRWSGILLYMGTDIISIYIFLQFMQSIPKALDEAARIDGAGHFTIYFRIILPLLRPAIATVIIIKGIAIYNDFYTPFLYMPDPNLGTVSTSLYRFIGPFSASWQVICAATFLVILPTLVVFLALQKYIYKGLSSGAVK
jgi:multiple sugar transport system permease protein